MTFAFETGTELETEVTAGTPADIVWSVEAAVMSDGVDVGCPEIAWSAEGLGDIGVAVLAESPQYVYDIPAYLVAIDYFVTMDAPADIVWSVAAAFVSDGHNVGCPEIA